MDEVIILGLSAYYHDSAAALVRNGRIVAAAQEERFTRKKGEKSFPHHAVDFCLRRCGISLREVTHIVFYEEPAAKFARILINSHMTAPQGLRQFLPAMTEQITDKFWLARTIRRELGTDKKILFCRHHMSHAASAFFPSPFRKAAILTVDGVGEWATASLGIGNENEIRLLHEMKYPNSVGLLYSAFTYYCGFHINSGEYKLMGLAPYGEPVYADTIKTELLHINADGSIVLNQKYFSYTYGLRTVSPAFEALFGAPARKPESPPDKHTTDIAASIQQVTEEILLQMARHLRELTGCRNLVLAGGVSLNVTATGALLRSGIFDSIWIQPAAGDAGGALGAALHLHYAILGKKRNVSENYDAMQFALLGPDIADTVQPDTGIYKELSEAESIRRLARLLADGKAIGLARGRMEFGPRALGNRSILCDARDPATQRRLNLQIKYREDFRPFAPVVLAEDAKQYFEMGSDSPYMLFTFYVQKERRLPCEKAATVEETVALVRSDIPAVTHVDYSARVQTVSRESNPFLWKLLQEFKRLTGCSVLVNTSFNVRGEPIVCTAADAYRCFMKTELDYVLIDNHLYEKTEQPPYTEAEKGAMALD